MKLLGAMKSAVKFLIGITILCSVAVAPTMLAGFYLGPVCQVAAFILTAFVLVTILEYKN